MVNKRKRKARRRRFSSERTSREQDKKSRRVRNSAHNQRVAQDTHNRWVKEQDKDQTSKDKEMAGTLLNKDVKMDPVKAPAAAGVIIEDDIQCHCGEIFKVVTDYDAHIALGHSH